MYKKHTTHAKVILVFAAISKHGTNQTDNNQQAKRRLYWGIPQRARERATQQASAKLTKKNSGSAYHSASREAETNPNPLLGIVKQLI